MLSLRTGIILICLMASFPGQAPGETLNPDWREIAQNDAGFLIWESNRTGRYRLWMRNLDGSRLRQISPEEKDRDHFCPHISPDGKYVVYLSYPANRNAYKPHPPQDKTPMHLLDIQTGEHSIIIQNARAYYENRAVVWIDNRAFIYIAGDGSTRKFNLDTRENRRLTDKKHGEFGWLINASKTHATWGRPTFSDYDADIRSIAPGKQHKGCQPYFSHDGQWGYWMGGAGGPIRRMHLSSGKIGDILLKNDPRLPAERRYLYFPMLSFDQRYLAYGASPNAHDHHNADYDIYIIRTDPKTLDVIGKPVRYTIHPGTDRYPTIYIRPIELGRHVGKAPLTINFKAPDTSHTWRWHIGTRRPFQGNRLTHTFDKPGRYDVYVQKGNQRLRGQVHVYPAQPPTVLNAVLRNDSEIVVIFDEPVRIHKLKTRLRSGTGIATQEISDDGYRLVLRLDTPLKKQDRLLLAGITDQAQKPNVMPPQDIPIHPPKWPVKHDGLVFLYQTGQHPNLAPMPGKNDWRTCAVHPRGQAYVNRDYAMYLSRGAFLAEDRDATLLNACKQTNQLTLEAVITPDHLQQKGPARIISFSSGHGHRNFTLGQEGHALVFRLRTPHTGENAVNPQVKLCALSEKQPIHIIITYQPGQLICYRNGEKVYETDRIQGDLSTWTPQHLVFGDEWNGNRDWSGTLEGVAIYNRVLSPEEARLNAQNYRKILLARPPVHQWVVQAHLLTRSETPTLEAISPYREALRIDEYQVQRVETGGDMPKRIRVAHWAILDGASLSLSGKTVPLTLESFDENTQLEGVFMSDTLEPDFDTPLFFAVPR